jgi:hypothetical protein
VLAYIAHQRNAEQKQFKEIWQALQTEYHIEISEREVGLLYRRIQALLMGNQVGVRQKLAVTQEEYGKLIMAVDALQPDGSGPKMYILYELLGGTMISIATLDQAKEDNLIEWLAPYREWSYAVEGTISDNEKALVAALKETFPRAVHQLCQMHFVKDLSEPVHEADRELQRTIREAMGQLPPVAVPERKTGDEITLQGENVSSQDENSKGDDAPRASLALMWTMDVISGIEVSTLDILSPEEWEDWWKDGSDSEGGLESVSYLSGVETREWIIDVLQAQVPMSARPLIEEVPNADLVTYWEHMRYRRAIQDTRHLGSRKPFSCGGLRGYQLLQAIDEHLAARQGLDSYLSKLHVCVHRAVEQARPLANDVRQAKEWVVKVERLLADEPVADGLQPLSVIQRQRMEVLIAECEKQQDGPTLQALQRTWRRMLDSWGSDLYHCYDIEGLPRSNLGVEALFGQARRQQRRLCGQADTSSLRVTGQGYLRATAVGQETLLEIFQLVPAWVYRTARRCVDAIEAGIRWPRQLHRDAARALLRFQLQADALHRRAAIASAPS